MRRKSARLLLAFVLLTKGSLTWQHPAGQTQRRASRNVIYFQDEYPVVTRVAGGEDSEIPSGVAAIHGGSRQSDGVHPLPTPPIVIPDKVNTPNREQILWDRIAQLRRQNIQAQQQRRPVSFPDPGVNIAVEDNNLARLFQLCGEFLERCANNEGSVGAAGHRHTLLHDRPVRDQGPHRHGHFHSNFFTPSVRGNFPIWPG
ncbi:uncharacterized protein LOC135206724 [Macrobrachium nipponense]|uniref:uncharacterized protein LOC135206724 n=1 Tax=Macrobrachium nipponense TaxID=159736 RepID=UPI0030C7B783